MDCGTEPYPLSSAINAGGSCFIDALPENPIQGDCGRPSLQVVLSENHIRTIPVDGFFGMGTDKPLTKFLA